VGRRHCGSEQRDGLGQSEYADQCCLRLAQGFQPRFERLRARQGGAEDTFVAATAGQPSLRQCGGQRCAVKMLAELARDDRGAVAAG